MLRRRRRPQLGVAELARREVPADEIIATSPQQYAAVANELRGIVKAAATEATEHGYPGWRGIGYRHPVAGYFCGIFPLVSEVKLLFEYGRHLPDPQGLLKGEGTQTRYVPVRSISDIVEEEITALAEAAVAFGVAKKGRLAEFRGEKRGAEPAPGDDRRDGRSCRR